MAQSASTGKPDAPVNKRRAASTATGTGRLQVLEDTAGDQVAGSARGGPKHRRPSTLQTSVNAAASVEAKRQLQTTLQNISNSSKAPETKRYVMCS